MPVESVDLESLYSDLRAWARSLRLRKVDGSQSRSLTAKEKEEFFRQVQAVVVAAAAPPRMSMASTNNARDSMARTAFTARRDGSFGQMRARWRSLPEPVRRSIVQIEQDRVTVRDKDGKIQLMWADGPRAAAGFEEVHRYVLEGPAGSVALWLLNVCGSPHPHPPRRPRGRGLRSRKTAKSSGVVVGRPGRPRNYDKRQVVQGLGYAYFTLTGRMPGRRGPFTRLVDIALGAIPGSKSESGDKVVRTYLSEVKKNLENFEAQREAWEAERPPTLKADE